MSDPTPIYNDIRTRRPNPKIPPTVKTSKRDRQRINKYAQTLTDRVWKEICDQWNRRKA